MLQNPYEFRIDRLSHLSARGQVPNRRLRNLRFMSANTRIASGRNPLKTGEFRSSAKTLLDIVRNPT